jgi:hypothetical protein
MSALPEQVQRQAAEAEAIEAALAAPPNDPATPPATPPAGDPAQPPAPAAPAPTPPAPAPEEPKDWEHRYRTLQGMIASQRDTFTAQVQGLQSQVVTLQGQITAKDQRIGELEAAARRTPEPPKPAPVSQEDTEKFGPEIIDLISRQAAHVAEQQVGPLKQELEATKAENAKLKQQVDGVAGNQAQSARSQYRADLTAACPTWEQVNVDPAFGTWLTVVDEFSGATRQALLTDAFNKNDAQRTATIFNQYLKQAAPPAPPPPPAPTPPSLASQQAPGASRTDTPPANPAADKVWTTAEVEAFYAAARRGEYQAADASRIEAEIDAAAASGRIR